MFPLYWSVRKYYDELTVLDDVPDPLACPPLYNPYYAIKPFWMLR
jgi:hypothetical protein